MGAYVVRRILISIPVLLGITILAFAALSFAPGDPLSARIDPELLARMSPEQIEEARAELGLDDALPVRYVLWLKGAVQGDLGYSVVNHRLVSEELGARIWPTLVLMGTALVLGTALGLALGVLAALKRNTPVDYSLAAISTSFVAIPGFVIGLVLIYAFGATWKLLPTSGMQTLGEPFSFVDFLRHLALPASILALALAAPLARYTRASMLEVMDREFVVTARAKGLRPRSVLLRHTFRNASIPIVTVIGLSLPDVVAGAVVIETLFGWPGMGQLAIDAASNRDAALMMGVILVVGLTVLFSNLLTDIAYGVVDPRVRLGKRA